jgi:hypothetical protein
LARSAWYAEPLALIENLAHAVAYHASFVQDCIFGGVVDFFFLFASCFPMTTLGLFELDFTFFISPTPTLSTKQVHTSRAGYKSPCFHKNVIF